MRVRLRCRRLCRVSQLGLWSNRFLAPDLAYLFERGTNGLRQLLGNNRVPCLKRRPSLRRVDVLPDGMCRFLLFEAATTGSRGKGLHGRQTGGRERSLSCLFDSASRLKATAREG